MFEQVCKNIDDALRKEDGCSTELDYIEQTSWVLFLKYLDDLEKEREGRATLEGRTYAPIIDAAHRWGVWAAPKKADGTLDQSPRACRSRAHRRSLRASGVPAAD